MEVPVKNGAADINARTALGVVLIDPSSGEPITDIGGSGGSGGSGGGTALPPNASQESGGNLDSISAAAGAPADAAYGGAGNGSIVGVLKGIFAAIKGALNIRSLSAAQDSVAVQGTVSVGNFPATQPVSGTVSITSTSRIAAFMSTSTLNLTAPGVTQVSFANVGSAAATIAGGSLPPGCSVTFDAPKGDTLSSIIYDGSATTLLISTVK